MKSYLSIDSEVFTRGVEDIVTAEELQAKLASKKPLRVKLGIDATSPDLHIGHAVPLWKIRAMQEHGHKAVIILGEFTTAVGDPTAKSATRPQLDPAVIKKNIASIRKQLGKILLTDSKVFELRKNSEWHGKMRTGEFLRLCALVTHGRLIERDMFQERIRQGKEITMAELLYPILQGYDSVAIRSDLTIIGSDQLFNEHFGRLFQEKFGQRPQCLITMKILPGLDGGEKMSKSLGNYIGLNDSPQDKFGKAMRLRDLLIIPYLETYTDTALAEIREVGEKLRAGMNPRDAKLFFAEALVRRYHGAAAAGRERERFLATFSERKTPSQMPEFELRSGQWSPVDLVTALELASSKSEARRLIKDGAIDVDGTTIRDSGAALLLPAGARVVVRRGSRKFAAAHTK